MAVEAAESSTRHVSVIWSTVVRSAAIVWNQVCDLSRHRPPVPNVERGEVATLCVPSQCRDAVQREALLPVGCRLRLTMASWQRLGLVVGDQVHARRVHLERVEQLGRDRVRQRLAHQVARVYRSRCFQKGERASTSYDLQGTAPLGGGAHSCGVGDRDRDAASLGVGARRPPLMSRAAPRRVSPHRTLSGRLCVRLCLFVCVYSRVGASCVGRPF